LHVIGEVSAADFSLVCHAMLLSRAKYKICARRKQEPYKFNMCL
jgi:hypothetical protein